MTLAMVALTGAALGQSGCIGGSILSAQTTKVDNKTFTVTPGGRLVMDVDRGSIEVTTGAGDKVDIEVTRTARSGSERDAERLFDDHHISMEQQGNTVTIQAELQRGGRRIWGSDSWRLNVEYHITVPKQFSVDLKTSGGGITVADLEGEVLAKSSGGGLHFGHIKGPVTGRTSGGGIDLDGGEGNASVKTSGGGIRIGDVNGEVDAETSGGSITIARARGRVTAHSSGGGIKVEEVDGTIDASTSGGSVTARITGQPKGNCRLETSGGSVTVYLGPSLKVSIDAKTSGGGVSTDLPLTVQGKLGSSSLQGDLNGGGPLLTLRTSGGGIHLKALSAAP